jgi:phenylalanyl-tRNA synthetase beta subunit
MTSIEWLRNELWEQFKWSFSDNIFEVAKEMHKAEQETLYTKEQMRKAYEYGNNYHKGSIADAQEYTFEKLMQSLKQHKQ